MSERDIRNAQEDVKQSTDDFERALDHLKDKIDQGTSRIQGITSHPGELLKEQGHNLERSLEGFLDDAIDLFQAKFQSFVRRSLDTVFDTLDESIESVRKNANRLLDDARGGMGELTQGFESSVKDGVRVLDERPLAGWMTVCLAGVFLGTLLSRRGSRTVGDTAPGSSEPIGYRGRSAA